VTKGTIAPYLEVAGPETREQPILLWAPRMRDATETITLPAGYRVARLPEDRFIDGDVASLHTHIEANGRRLTYTYKLIIKQREISPDEYDNFREVVQEALSLPEDLVVLERG